jgi:hypothetical protein
VVVTAENRAEILEQLAALRAWFAANEPLLLPRLDLLVNALTGVRFDAGETAWIG